GGCDSDRYACSLRCDRASARARGGRPGAGGRRVVAGPGAGVAHFPRLVERRAAARHAAIARPAHGLAPAERAPPARVRAEPAPLGCAPPARDLVEPALLGCARLAHDLAGLEPPGCV